MVVVVGLERQARDNGFVGSVLLKSKYVGNRYGVGSGLFLLCYKSTAINV
jgi:hypothetical protein